MNLLMISHYFETHRGGIEIVACSLARELANRGIDVTWMATDASSVSATTENVTRIALRASNFLERTIGIPYPLAYPTAWRRIFRETKRADAVLIHDGLYLTSVVASLSASWAGKPYIVVQHIETVPYNNVLLRSLMSVANKVIARTVLKHADQIVFISEVTQRYFADLECTRLPRVIFNGLDTNVFNPPGNDIEAIEASSILISLRRVRSHSSSGASSKKKAWPRCGASRGNTPASSSRLPAGAQSIHASGTSPMSACSHRSLAERSPRFIEQAAFWSYPARAKVFRSSSRKRWPAACQSSAVWKQRARTRRRALS